MYTINLSITGYQFYTKPLLFAGKAMEYYGLREANDIDFIITQADYLRLLERFPQGLKVSGRDTGVCVDSFEFWTSFYGFAYDFLAVDALEMETYCVISLEKLLFLKALTVDTVKGRRDVQLLLQKIVAI